MSAATWRMRTREALPRGVVMAADVAFVLGTFVTFVVALHLRSVARAWRVVEVLVVAVGSIGGVALLLALPMALLSMRARWLRGAVGLLGCVVGGVALRLDAVAYVRLYGWLHAALGVATLVGALAVRAALPVRRAWVGVRAAALAVAMVLALCVLRVSQDVRALVATRGVLVADVLWVTHPDAETLPPVHVRRDRADTVLHPLSTRPKLILLLTVDALRYDAAHAAAFRAFATVRGNAVDFTQARAPAAWTVPSVYGIMTGRGPWSIAWTRARFFDDRPVPYSGTDRDARRVWPMPVRDRSVTLAEALHAGGYQTRTCASLPFFLPGTGVSRGFDVVDTGVYAQRNRDLRGTTSDLLTACGIAMIDAAQGAPLFLWLHYSDPHEPYEPHPGLSTVDDDDVQRYAGEVAFVDRHIAALLVHVQRVVGLDDTLVVLTADHGEEFGEHGGQYHAVDLYDEVARVPLMIASARLAPREVSASVSLLDLAPTVLDLVGAPGLADAEGRSLAAAMSGAAMAPRPVMAESVRYGWAIRSVVADGFKLVYGARTATYQLYDLRSDPDEQCLLTDERPEVVAQLARMMGVPGP